MYAPTYSLMLFLPIMIEKKNAAASSIRKNPVPSLVPITIAKLTYWKSNNYDNIIDLSIIHLSSAKRMILQLIYRGIYD